MICYSRHCVETITNLVFDIIKSEMVGSLSYKPISQGSVKFCVIEVFKFWVRCRYKENKELQDPNLGDAQGNPMVIFKEYPSN